MKNRFITAVRLASVILILLMPSAGHAQISNRQHTLDSLKEVIDTQKDSLPALRQYIDLLGLSNDTVTTQFNVWMKQFPKMGSFPYALGEAYYKARDRKAVDYIVKAVRAGDTAKRVLQLLHFAFEERWQVDVLRTVNTVDSLRKVVENNPDSLLPLQQYIYVLGIPNDTVTMQIDAWMKQFPGSAAIPFAIGQSYYNDESPRATRFLLRVVELQPANAKVYEMLSIDAERWGNNDKSREYMGKAATAEPENPDYALDYVYAFENVDPAMWREKTWEFTKRFPHDNKGAGALSWLAHGTADQKEKRNILEQLRKLYPPAEYDASDYGMGTLYDLYLQEGLTDQAIELAASMGDKEGFPGKLELAKYIAAVRMLIKEKKYAEAQKKAAHIKLPRYSGAVNVVALLKAEVTDAAGSPQDAYDSLLVIQAKTPDAGIRDAIAKYGTKLGKNAAQTEKELWVIRDRNSKPAPPFELGLYTSGAKAKLEDYRGKVILLTFWFPGCGPCRGEMPHFENVVKKFDRKDLAFLGVNVYPEQDDYVLPFMKGTKFSFTPLRGNANWAEKVYHVWGEPTNFLIDQEGKIVYSNFMIDGNNEHMLEMMINSMLAKKG